MMSRKIRLILALLVVAGLLGYRFLAPKPDAAGQPATATTTAEPVAAGKPKSRMLGRIAFTSCSLDSPFRGDPLAAQCARFEVPEDRSRPDGRRIALNIAWLPPGQEADAAPDPVFFLAGGPGQAAVETYPTLDPAFAEVRKQRGIVLVDQRGTGGSNVLSCRGDEALDEASAAADAAQAAACAKTLSAKADLRHYTTTDAVADLEAVRRAIGAPEINLVGVSYGTRVAQQYAMRHPENTRSIVLDSVVPNTLGLGNIFARNLDDALAQQFALCTKSAACTGKLGDPRAELDALLAKLRAAPVPVQYRDATSGEMKEDTLTAEHVAGLVRMYAYMPAAGALLPKLIHEANQGRPANLMALSQLMTGDLEDAMAMGMQLSVVCSEDRASMVANAEDAGTVLGSSIVDSMAAACAVWPAGAMPADFHQPLATDVPALLLSGEFDPVTPPRYGEEVAKSLPNGRHLVLRGQGHNVIGAGCMPKLFTQFIEKVDAKALDAGCLDHLAYVPPFTSFNGWEP